MGGRRTNNDSMRHWHEARARQLAARFDAVRPLVPAFISDIIRTGWALVSPASRLSDFESIVPPAEMARRISDRYGVAVESLPDDLVVTLLESIAAGRGTPGKS